MVKSILSWCLAIIVLSLMAAPASSTAGTWDSFDRPDGSLGSTATGLPWSTFNSTWGVRRGHASILTTRYADTLAYATVNVGASTGFTASADITLSATPRRANAGLTVLFASPSNNIFCKTEVTHGNPLGLMSIGRRLNGRTTSLLASIREAGFANGQTYHVTCGRSGDEIAMTVSGEGVGPLSISYVLTSTDLAAFGSATTMGFRSHVFTDEDDRRSTFDNFVVTLP